MDPGRWMKLLSILFVFTVLFSQPALQVVGYLPLEKGPVAGGNISVIVLPVIFKDLDNQTSLEQIERRVFVELNEYFHEVSYGRLRVTGEIAPGWYRLSRPMSWYGWENERWESLIYDAVREADHDVNYRDYSFIMIVHAGDDESRSLNQTDIISFGTHGRAGLQTLDGRFAFGISCLAELDPIGPYAHFLALNLGLPYLHKSWQEVGEWDLMAHGFWAANGTKPVHPTSIAKLEVGWLDEDEVATVELNDKTSIELKLLEEPSLGVKAVKVPVGEDKYFMIEARERVGFDKYLPGEGVLILYADETAYRRKGAYKVVDGSPETETLDDAALKPGEWYVNQTAMFAVKVNSHQNNSYGILIDRSGDVREASIIVETGLPGIEVAVDDKVSYTNASGSIKFRLIPGEYKVKVPEKIDYGNDTAEIFLGWGDGVQKAERNVQADGTVKLSAVYKRAYMVEVDSPYGDVEGEGWYTISETAFITVNGEVDQGNGTKRVFDGWSTGSESTSIEVTVNEPKIIGAYWDTQYRLRLKIEGLPMGVTVPLTCNGKNVNVVTPDTFETWIYEGGEADIQLPDSIEAENKIFRLEQMKINGSIVTPPLTVDKPLEITASYIPTNSTDEVNLPTSTPDPEVQIPNPIEAFLQWLYDIANKTKESLSPSN